jgi:LacI family transcriptional regulator
MKHVSLREIAERVGVSTMTVSRALRGEPRVAGKVRRKIKRVARELGYIPDPRLKALLGHMRQRKTEKERETMMLVLPDSGVREVKTLGFLKEIVQGVRTRATTRGFRLELHSLRDEPDVQVFERVLQARGVDLLIIAPYVHSMYGTLALHWERYAAVAMGPALWRPRLSRVVNNYYVNMVLLLRQLKRLGYQRPALVCRESVLARLMYVWEAAFKQFAPLVAGLERPERYVWRGETNGRKFREWLRMRRVDVVVGDYSGDLAVLRKHKFRVPEEIGFVTLTQEPGISAFDSRLGLLGAHAVDLVAEQFYYNERGVPKDPKLVLHEGVWRSGGTTLRKVSL